ANPTATTVATTSSTRRRLVVGAGASGSGTGPGGETGPGAPDGGPAGPPGGGPPTGTAPGACDGGRVTRAPPGMRDGGRGSTGGVGCRHRPAACTARRAGREARCATGSGGRAPGSAEDVLAVAAQAALRDPAAARLGVRLELAVQVGRVPELVAGPHVAVVAGPGVGLERRVVVDLGVVERRRRRRAGIDRDLVVARVPRIGRARQLRVRVGQPVGGIAPPVVDVVGDVVRPLRLEEHGVDQPPAVPADDGEVDGVRVAPAGAVLDRHRGAVPGLLL